MKSRVLFLSLIFILLAEAPTLAQHQVFRISEFEHDPFDLSASSQSAYKKTDGSGDLYAIVKVKSNNPEDNLSAYQFDFGLMNHETTMHNGELWLYVQKNAQFVTVSRSGFNTVSKYDLGTSLESGKTYVLHISTNGPVILTQMVQFSVKPVGVNAAVMIKSSAQGAAEEMLGVVNQYGEVAKALPYGTYTYRIVAEDYHPIQGQITLNDRNNTLVENADLQPNGVLVTLRVDADADIYVNGQLKGHKEWKGVLKTGACHVECKSPIHKTSSQYITVQEGQAQEFNLTSPELLTGTLAITSQPFGATIYVDGNQVGKSPKNINDLAVGKHTVRLVREGFEDASKEVEIQKDQTTELSLSLQKNDNIERPTNTASGNLTFTVKDVKFTMVKVEAGTFTMGIGRLAHQVTLSNDFYIGKTEVTQALWEAVMDENPSWFDGAELPVEKVSWDDCQTFITKLNSLTGSKFRLPTEAEWEFAARGGNKSRGYKYSGSDRVDDVAWYNDKTTHPVKKKRANELGIYDMSGNVWEWCNDWYDDYSKDAQTDPKGAISGIGRINRGGGWDYKSNRCLVTYRGKDYPNSCLNNVGFRLALDMTDIFEKNFMDFFGM